MDKRNGLLIIFIFALIAAGIYNFYYFSERRKAQSEGVVPKSKLTTTPRKADRIPEKTIQKIPLKASPQNLLLTLPEGWGRNPFLTPAEIKQIHPPEADKNSSHEKEAEPLRPLPEYVVTSIVISGDKKVAVINGKIVSPGDHIGREIVKDISTVGVELAMEGNLRIVKLKQGRTEVKTRIP